MRRFAWCWLLLPLAGAHAQGVSIPGPDAGTRRFGESLVQLPNGGYLVTDPEWSAGDGAEGAGAIYLYAADGTLVSRLTGSSAGDRVGSGGVVVLGTGDFVVHSPAWDAPGAIADAGAVTWVDADLGLQGSVAPGNSLVGGSPGDQVGSRRAVRLANGSFVVASPDWDRAGVATDAGAVTWCAADGSTLGAVGLGNSLVGSQPDDRIGDPGSATRPGVVALRSGHYVVFSPAWDNGPVADAGAVTWANGDGTTAAGVVGVDNSLVGTQALDRVGSNVVALEHAQGHYVVLSPFWDDGGVENVGAATWASGTQATTGPVSTLNSLVGSQPLDRIGAYAAPLANGNYVVTTPFWSNGPAQFAGAATWRNGDGPHPGVVSPANSLVGASYGDQVGYFTSLAVPPLGIVPLPNGHYLVATPEWNRGPDRLRAGALTWGDGTSGVNGVVGVDNSLVGVEENDRVAQYVRVLADGNYVVASPFWSERRGAATWGDGAGPLVGEVGAGTSLVGRETSDFVTAYGILALPDGGYAIPTPEWLRESDGAPVGAVTRAAPGGIAGVVSADNSFTGGEGGDFAGSGGVTFLANGDLLVRSELASAVGGFTRIPVDAQPGDFSIGLGNSMSGSEAEPLGNPGAVPLSDGAVVALNSTGPADGSVTITLFAADEPFRGAVPAMDTVRTTVVDGESRLSYSYLAAQKVLLVGDPLGNRVVRLTRSRLFHDRFE